MPLADYYAAKGEVPGRWIDSGLDGIDALAIRDLVTAEQMKILFGSGRDPITGRPLGSAYKVYANETAVAFKARVDELLAHAPVPTPAERATARSTAAREFFVAENGRGPASVRELSAALATYTRPRPRASPRSPVGPVQRLRPALLAIRRRRAIAPPEIATKIERSHQAAVADALAFVERAPSLPSRVQTASSLGVERRRSSIQPPVRTRVRRERCLSEHVHRARGAACSPLYCRSTTMTCPECWARPLLPYLALGFAVVAIHLLLELAAFFSSRSAQVRRWEVVPAVLRSRRSRRPAR